MIYVLFSCIFLLGLVIGSFFNVLIYRLPRNEEVVVTPSHCTKCNSKIKAYDLVPLFSYLFLGGKCRNCKEKISIQYPLIELLTGMVFFLTTFFVLKSVDFVPTLKVGLRLFILLVLFGTCIPIFFIDLKHYIIPNGLIIFGLVFGLVLKVASSLLLNDWGILLDGVYGLLIGFGIFMAIMYLGQFFMKTEVMGMGDVKLVGMLGLFLGFKLTLVCILFAYIVGTVFSIILLCTRKKTKKDLIPFGPFIVIGMVVAITCGEAILKWYLSGI